MMKTPEIRMEICRLAGTNQTHYHGLEKRTLLSVYAYLTGELPCRPALLYTDRAPTCQELRLDIAIQCYSTAPKIMNEWIKHDDYANIGRNPFRKRELQPILETMQERDDQRDWLEGTEAPKLTG